MKIALAKFKALPPDAAMCCEKTKAIAERGSLEEVVRVDLDSVFVGDAVCGHCGGVFTGKIAAVVGHPDTGIVLDFYDLDEGGNAG